MDHTLLIFVSIVVGILVLMACLIYRLAVYPFRKIRKESGEGCRTIFEIDTTDYGYEYYENMLLKWLDGIGYGKYEPKKKGRRVKYFCKGGTYRFGLNYYRQENKLIIETWVIIFRREYPLVTVLRRIENCSEELYRAVDQQPKDVYIELLQSLMHLPQTIQDTNEATFVREIRVSNVKAEQKKERASIRKLIAGIIAFSIACAIIIENPFQFGKPKGSQEDLMEGLQLIERLYPDFQLEKKCVEVKDHRKYDTGYFIMYLYYGTMNTPLEENDEVMFLLQKSSESGRWSGTIYNRDSSDIRWDLYYRQEE